MKKNLLLFTLIMTAVTGIQAQGSFKWGVMAGINSSSFSTAEFDSRTGFHIGIKAEMELPQMGQGVYLDMAALLSQKGATSKEAIHGKKAAPPKFNPCYLEIPVHIGYKYAVSDNIALLGNFGPYFAVGLFGEMGAKAHGIQDSQVSFGDDAVNRLDFGLGLKAGVAFSQKFQVTVGYDWGLVENMKDTGQKNRNLMLSLGYLF